MKVIFMIFLITFFLLAFNALLQVSFALSSLSPLIKSEEERSPAAILNSPSASPINQTWIELGPRPITLNNQPLYSGRVTAIAINGSNPSNIYIGAAQGGVWKSEDGGANWIPLTDNMPYLAIGEIAFSPDYKIIYAGLGEPNHSGDSYSGAGILKSADGGKTWAILGSSQFKGSSISAILVNSNNPNRVLVSTTFGSCCNGFRDNSNLPLGVYLSNDGGISWTQVLAPYGDRLGFSDLLSSPSDPNTVYASSFNGTVWLSRDAGSSWSKILYATDPGCSQGLGCRTELAMSNAQPSLLFSALSDPQGDLYGIFKYDISTRNITSLTRPPQACGTPPFVQCNYDLLIEVDPSNPSIIYFGGTDLFRSYDGGASWVDLGGYTYNQIAPNLIHVDQHALAFLPGNPGTIFVGNDGGVWKSTDRGNTWTNLNAGLGITQFYSIAGSPDSTLIGGTQDNGCLLKNTNSNIWQYSLGGDGMWVAVESSNPNILYCGEYYLNFYRSTDGGITWTKATNGINMSDESLFNTPYAQDPNNPGTIYAAGTHVYKTTNFASSWFDVSGPIGNNRISALAVAQRDSSVVYLGDIEGNIKISRNGGSTWQTIGSGLGYVVSIDADPNNTETIYVVAGGSNQIYKFYFSGGIWHQISLSPLPYFPNVVKLDKQSNIYVGTDHGVYYSSDKGNSWSKLGNGLPNAAVYSLLITKQNQLIVGTHGRGVWIIPLPPTQIPIVLSYSVKGGGSGYSAPLFTYYYQGIQRRVQLSTTPTTYTVDVGSTWSVTAILNGSTQAERWATNGQTSGTLNSSFTFIFTYYHQYSISFNYNIVGGSTGQRAELKYYQFGSELTLSSSSTIWADADTPWSVPLLLSGSTLIERWITDSKTTNGTVTSSLSISLTYYHQFNVEFDYTVKNGMSSSIPTISYYSFGLYNTGMGNEKYWVDANSQYTYQNPLHGSNSSIRWATSNPSGIITSQGTISITYYQQYPLTLSYTVEGGGTNFEPPLLVYTQFDQQKSATLGTESEVYWADALSNWSVQNPLVGSTSIERWIAISATEGKVSGSLTINLVYQHQYYVNIISYPSAGGSALPKSGWYNATQSLQISAIPSTGWKFNAWIGTFQLANNTISIIVNQPINETATFYPGLTITSGSNGFITYSYGERAGKVQGEGTITIYVPLGTNVTLSASPSLFIYSFEGWQGAITGKSSYTSVIVNSPTRVTASFTYNYTALGIIAGASVASIIAILYIMMKRRR